jgi:DNA transformation protein
MFARSTRQVSPFPDLEFMAKHSEFVEHVVETMRQFGPVEARAMFGGWGLYHRGLFFALILDETLYLKADDESRAGFEALGLEQCAYPIKDGRTIVMSYRRAPEEALEDPAVMADWARRGYAAALRAAARKGPKARAAKKRRGIKKA